MSNKQMTAPPYLKGEARALYLHVAATYDVSEAHHSALLRSACEQLQEAAELRGLLEQEGRMVRDRFGQPKAHPALSEMRACHNSFRLLLRELGLDIEGTAASSAAEAVRLPRAKGYA